MTADQQHRAPTATRPLLGVGIAAAGTAALLALTGAIGQQSGQDLGRYALYQAAALLIAALVVGAVRLATGADLPRWGDLRAPARPVRALGIRDGESWRKVGITFAIIISVVTGVFLVLAYGTQLGRVEATSWMLALLVAVPLSATNALTEELVTRWAVVASLGGSRSRLAPWASALIFGGVHWFGIPGGPAGALMAGFLGWLLARSVQDTRGIGWAWIIHFSQDVLIFTLTIALFL